MYSKSGTNHEESDEDCEVYYLKPVNEYNIVDRIKAANRELLDFHAPKTMDANQRRVKFNDKLEEYEPGVTIDDFFDIVDCDEHSVERKIFESLDEAKNDENVEEHNEEEEPVVEEIVFGESVSNISDGEIEEICEEIVNLAFGPKVERTTPGTLEEINEQSVATTDETTDDEDILSTLVASYIPDNVPTPVVKHNAKPYTPKRKSKTACFNFGCKKSSKVSSSAADLSLKLNYKTCCEFRNAENQRLPKYMGYLSEYGLTKEQLDAREKRLETSAGVVHSSSSLCTDAQYKKICENEKAFTNWLKNKIKYPVNKTVNLFDYKGSVRQSHITSYCVRNKNKSKTLHFGSRRLVNNMASSNSLSK